MCATCGCSDGAQATITDPATGETLTLRAAAPEHAHVRLHAPGHHHGRDAHHDHAHHDHTHSRTIALEQAILEKNDKLAERNRRWLAGRGIVALNLVSSPGSGKTTLLERTLRDLEGQLTVTVIEGDQASARDADRIRATGVPVIQINTGTGCHLEADMVARGLEQLDPPLNSLLIVENVGNLVCPALFDLGERAKVLVASTTEGEDKPLKYPHMFRAASLILLNKVDLLEHLDFEVDRFLEAAEEVAPGVPILHVSARRGDGLDAWYGWIREQLAGPVSLAHA